MGAHRTDHARREYVRQPVPSFNELDDELTALDGLVRRLEQRGGRVVFVRLPSSGARWELEEHFHPREEYWTQFPGKCGGEWIHFRDVPGMRDVLCPDGCHVDCRNTRQFTHALIEELSSRGIITAGE
jgi:hypothetical protein